MGRRFAGSPFVDHFHYLHDPELQPELTGSAEGQAVFRRKVRSSMRQLQNDPRKNISFFPKRLLEYAA